jgi:hypothetical protein
MAEDLRSDRVGTDVRILQRCYRLPRYLMGALFVIFLVVVVTESEGVLPKSLSSPILFTVFCSFGWFTFRARRYIERAVCPKCQQRLIIRSRDYVRMPDCCGHCGMFLVPASSGKG